MCSDSQHDSERTLGLREKEELSELLLADLGGLDVVDVVAASGADFQNILGVRSPHPI